MSTDPTNSDFDATAWRRQQGSTSRNNPRGGMVASLEATVLKVGMPKSKVREILGAPEGATERKDIYALGVSRFGIDFEEYVIEYDEQDLVARFYLRRR